LKGEGEVGIYLSTHVAPRVSMGAAQIRETGEVEMGPVVVVGIPALGDFAEDASGDGAVAEDF